MSEFKLKNIEIQEDKNEEDIIKKIIESSDDDEPFFILDIEQVVRKHRKWLTKIPRVTPYYGKVIIFFSTLTYYIYFFIPQ